MKKHLLIDPGMLPLDRLIDVFIEATQNYKITLLTESRRKKQFEKILKEEIPLKFYEDFTIEKGDKLDISFLQIYNKAVIEILNDNRTLLIAERVNNLNQWNSLFNKIPLVEKIVFNFLFYYQNNPVDEILFQATPHNFFNWVLAKTAEIAGIKVKMIQTSPLPWRYWIVEGLDAQMPIFPKKVSVSLEDISALEKYIQLNQRDYKSALPEYEKKRLEKRKGKYWSWKREFNDIFKHPKKILSIKSKIKSYKLYNSLAKYPSAKTKNIVFFLHYQPERTSMPEALNYSNQWLIIKKLTTSLPENVMLYVKEHPSMFTNNFDTRYRNNEFYSDISKLKNVQLVPLDSDTFEIIDNSEAIVTITGTVGVQALIRGKAVICFGVASYRGLKNVYEVSIDSDIQVVISEVLRANALKSDELKDRFLSVIEQSVSGLQNLDINDEIIFYKRNNRIKGHLRIIGAYLK